MEDQNREDILIGVGFDGKFGLNWDFDAAFTAPRWGFKDVESYYKQASPFSALNKAKVELPPTLLVQAIDDPWVPSYCAEKLEEKCSSSKVLSSSGYGNFLSIGS